MGTDDNDVVSCRPLSQLIFKYLVMRDAVEVQAQEDAASGDIRGSAEQSRAEADPCVGVR